MRFTWLADFDTILDAIAEANVIKYVVKNNHGNQTWITLNNPFWG
jgi:uncharacterized protein YbcV (DUF1398 family)